MKYFIVKNYLILNFDFTHNGKFFFIVIRTHIMIYRKSRHINQNKKNYTT